MKIFYLACMVFIINCVPYCVKAQACTIGGSPIPGVILTQDFPDTSTPESYIDRLSAVNVAAVDASESPYFDAALVGDMLEVKVKPEFSNFEKNMLSEGQSSPYTWQLKVACNADPIKFDNVPVMTQIVDSNNNKPAFDNGPFQYNIPSPFPGGISLTQNYEQICVTDYDITDINNDSEFVLDPPNELFTITTTSENDFKKNCANLVTKNWLESAGNDIILTVKAQNTGNSTMSATTTVTIRFEDTTSLPREPKFGSDYYSGSVENVETPPETQIPLQQNSLGFIEVSDPGTNSYQFRRKGSNGWDDTFDIRKQSESTAALYLIRSLTEEDLIKAQAESIILVVEAYPENYIDKTSTVAVFITLPQPTTTTVTTPTTTTTVTTTNTPSTTSPTNTDSSTSTITPVTSPSTATSDVNTSPTGSTDTTNSPSGTTDNTNSPTATTGTSSSTDTGPTSGTGSPTVTESTNPSPGTTDSTNSPTGTTVTGATSSSTDTEPTSGTGASTVTESTNSPTDITNSPTGTSVTGVTSSSTDSGTTSGTGSPTVTESTNSPTVNTDSTNSPTGITVTGVTSSSTDPGSTSGTGSPTVTESTNSPTVNTDSTNTPTGTTVTGVTSSSTDPGSTSGTGSPTVTESTNSPTVNTDSTNSPTGTTVTGVTSSSTDPGSTSGTGSPTVTESTNPPTDNTGSTNNPTGTTVTGVTSSSTDPGSTSGTGSPTVTESTNSPTVNTDSTNTPTGTTVTYITSSSTDPGSTSGTGSPTEPTTAQPPPDVKFDADVYSGEMYVASYGPTVKVSATPGNPANVVTYYLQNVPVDLEGNIIIDESTGQISTTKPVTEGQYDFEAVASVNTGSTDTADVTLIVKPKSVVTDNWPAFGSPFKNYQIAENDADATVDLSIPGASGDDLKISYAFVDPTTSEKYFRLDTTSGVLSLAQPLDREDPEFQNTNVVEVKIKAFVEGMDPPTAAVRRDELVVLISVTDVNDNAPTFNDNTVQYVGYPAPGIRGIYPTAIMTVKADDKDMDAANRVTGYEVSNSAKFFVDSETGAVYPKGDTPPECTQECQFSVTAFDVNDQTLHSDLQIAVVSLKENQIHVMDIDNIALSDLDSFITELSNDISLSVGVLYAYEKPATRRMKRASSGSVQLYLYALNAQHQPVDYNTFNAAIENTQFDQTWKIAGVVPLPPVVPPVDNNNNSSSNSDAGLLTAVIILSVILGLIVLALAALGYVKLTKRKGLDWKQPWKKTTPFYVASSSDTNSNGSAHVLKGDDWSEPTKVSQNYDSVIQAFDDDRHNLANIITEEESFEVRNTASNFTDVNLVTTEGIQKNDQLDASSYVNNAFEQEEVKPEPEVNIPDKDYSPQSSPSSVKKLTTSPPSEGQIYEELPSLNGGSVAARDRKKSTVTFREFTEIIIDDDKTNDHDKN